MTPELEVLGRRAVACKGWRCMPGMMNDSGQRIIESNFGLRTVYFCYEGLTENNQDDAEDAIPDFSDPATVGCLVALVREVLNEPSMHSMYKSAPQEGWWIFTKERHRHLSPTYKTEAEAWLWALENAE